MSNYELTMYFNPSTISSANKTRSINLAFTYLFVNRTNTLNAKIKYKYFKNFINYPFYRDVKLMNLFPFILF